MQRAEGAEPFVMVRITKFQSLNVSFSCARCTTQAIDSTNAQRRSSGRTMTMTQLPGGMDGDYNQTTAHRGDVVSQIAMQDRIPYAYRLRYDSTGE